MKDEYKVTYDGEEFVLVPPSTEIVLRMVNVVADVSLRSEAAMAKVVGVLLEGDATEITNFDLARTLAPALLGLLASMEPGDLVRLASAALQFEDDHAGRAWVRERGVRLGPLARAVMANVRMSDAFVEDLRDFLSVIGLSTADVSAKEAKGTKGG